MSDFKLGEHDAMIRALDTRTTEMAADIKYIKDILAEQRGERHVKSVGFGMVGGGVAGLFIKILASHLGFHS